MPPDKALFVIPRYPKSRYRPVVQAGVGYLAESLLAAGIEHRVIDMGLPGAARDMRSALRDFRPEFIGISMQSFRYRDHYRLAEQIKEASPRARIAVGGPHAALFGGQVLGDCAAVNFVFKGEAEDAFARLCSGAEPGSIPGLAYRDGDATRDTGDPQRIPDIDRLPFPTYRGFPLDRYVDPAIHIMPIVSSRGCPCRCTFCPVHQSMGRRFRARTAPNVLAELEYWYERGYRRFGFADDNFTHDKERVIEICRGISERRLQGLRLSLDNGVRADRVDRALLTAMREAGFWRIAYGIEAAHPRVLADLGKDLTIDSIRKAVSASCELGYTVRLFFLVGSPGETWAEFEESLSFARQYPIFEASFYNVIPYPGTELYAWIERHGRFLERPDDYLHSASGRINRPVFETPDFPAAQRRKAFALARTTSRRITRAALARKFASVPFGALASRLYGVYPLEHLARHRIASRLARRFIARALEPDTAAPPPDVAEHYAVSDRPRVSVVIPSLDGVRGGNVPKLIADFDAQTYRDFELHIVKNVAPQGKAINIGCSRARGEILMIADDDSRLGGPRILETLVAVLDGDPTIGMAGAAIGVPASANWLQRRAAREFPRFNMKVPSEVTDSDMACHGFCAFPKKVFDEVGREREDVVRGLDPDLRHRLRERGYRVVLAPGAFVSHPLPGTIRGLIRMFFRNGRGSAYMQRYRPDIVYETDEALEWSGKGLKNPFFVRVLRFPVRLLGFMARGQVVRAFGGLFYAAGFVWEWISNPRGGYSTRGDGQSPP